jgi:hypothetical protein
MINERLSVRAYLISRPTHARKLETYRVITAGYANREANAEFFDD